MATADNVNAWSSTAASNASSDSTISSSDSQSPDTLDNNIRDVMAAVRNWQKDIGGFATAGGSANAHTVTSASVISASHLTDGYRITYYAPATNTSATVTVAIDGLTATNILRADGSALAIGSIIADMVLDLVYESGGGSFRAINIGPAAGASAPGMVCLTSGTVAAAALNIVLTGYTAYRGIKIFLSGFLPVTDGVNLVMRLSTDGGSTYDAGVNAYGYDLLDAGVVHTGTITSIPIAFSSAIGNVSSEGYNGEITLLNQSSAAFFTRAQFSGSYMTSAATSALASCVGSGARLIAQDTDAVRFLFGAGNIAAGNYAVYGLV